MTKKKIQTTRVLQFKALVGDATPLMHGKHPLCAKCEKRVMTGVLSLIQYGFWEDVETDVFYCKHCGEYSAYTYQIAFEVKENGN